MRDLYALSVTFGDSSPKGGAKTVEGAFLASPFGRGGCDHREQTERAPPLPCGELPPQPVGSSASKSLRPCRAEHAAFASQTGLRLKSPTGAFMPSGHRRPFWFSFGTQKRTCPAENHCIKAIPPIPRENALHGNITANSSAPLSPPRGSAHRWRAGCAHGSGAGRPVPACLPGPPTRWSGSSSA